MQAGASGSSGTFLPEQRVLGVPCPLLWIILPLPVEVAGDTGSPDSSC